MTFRHIGKWIPAIVIGAGAVGLVGWFIIRSESLAAGPEEIVWDHAQCAECRMSVTERPWAAQLQTRDGRVLNFDDPGCLFQFQADEDPQVHALWFRHVREDRWLAEAAVAFLETGPSPMGYDLGAVNAGTAGAISIAAARLRCVRSTAIDAGKEPDAH